MKKPPLTAERSKLGKFGDQLAFDLPHSVKKIDLVRNNYFGRFHDLNPINFGGGQIK